MVSLGELQQYAEALETNGFFGPNAFYMNHAANARYAAEAVNNGRLDMPVLFLAARYDYTCESIRSRLTEPMRAHCPQLTEHILDTGHWMAQEAPNDVNAALSTWLREQLPAVWPR
ncbi:MAG: alpha/beta hydrolase [Pseudomonadota bacterium]